MTVPEHPTSFEPPIPRPPLSPSGQAVTDVQDGAGPESVPQSWDESRDPVFFASTARLFRPATTLAMTVLLASHDVDPPASSTGPSTRLTEVRAGSSWPLGDTASSDYAS